MFEAAVQQLEGGIGESTVRLTNPVFMAKLRIAFLLLVILFLAVRLLLKFWFVGDQDWPYGLTPTWYLGEIDVLKNIVGKDHVGFY